MEIRGEQWQDVVAGAQAVYLYIVGLGRTGFVALRKYSIKEA